MQDTYEDEIEPDLPRFEPEPDVDVSSRVRASETEVVDPRHALAVRMLRQVHDTIGQVLELLKGEDSAEGTKMLAEMLSTKAEASRFIRDTSGGRVLEGVFDGVAMIGEDGKSYPVPQNYASKSKLVEGDVMKLTVRPDGTFIYKQIRPIERRRVTGRIAFDASANAPVAICGSITYRILPASVTFFHGAPGDEVVCLVPNSGKSVWAAVENVIKK